MEDERLKQRLIGAIVLLSLAVMFIPMFLGGEARLPERAELTIPPRPDSATPGTIIDLGRGAPADRQWLAVDYPTEPATPVAEPLAVAGRAPANDEARAIPSSPPQAAATAAPQAATSPPASASPPAEPPVADYASSTASEGWAVQVGSFTLERNALGLRDRLRAKGHPAFVEAFSTPGGTVYRVRVGPEGSRTAADLLRETLQQEFALQGVVMRHP